MHLLYLELQLILFFILSLSFVLKQKKQKFKAAYNFGNNERLIHYILGNIVTINIALKSLV